MGRNVPADVFRFIDTKDNDVKQCWPWTGSLGGTDGRGYFTLDGRKQLAHRIVYRLFHGELEEGQVVRHTCDNPRCCNPMHLEKGSRSDNEMDKYKRGRAGYPLHVINEMQKLQREARRNGENITYQQIANRINETFNIQVSPSGVGRILRGDRRQGQTGNGRRQQ